MQVLVIIDAKPKDLGLPTEAYVAVEEVHDVSITTTFNPNFYIMGLQYVVYQGQFNSRFSWGGCYQEPSQTLFIFCHGSWLWFSHFTHQIMAYSIVLSFLT